MIPNFSICPKLLLVVLYFILRCSNIKSSLKSQQINFLTYPLIYLKRKYLSFSKIYIKEGGYENIFLFYVTILNTVPLKNYILNRSNKMRQMKYNCFNEYNRIWTYTACSLFHDNFFFYHQTNISFFLYLRDLILVPYATIINFTRFFFYFFERNLYPFFFFWGQTAVLVNLIKS